MYLAASDQSINVHLYLYTICSLSGRYLHLCHQFLLTCGLLDDGRILLLQDRTCIVWDLAKEVYFVRELGDHPGPVVMLAINQMNVICVFVHMCVWVWVWMWVRVWVCGCGCCVHVWVCAYVVGVGEGVVCTSGCVHML